MFFHWAMGIEVVKTATYPHVRFCVLNSVPVTQQHYSASSNLNDNYLVVMNLHDGVDLYSVPSMQLIKTYSHGNANIAIFKVSFVDKGWLVSGGQDGFARMYDVRSGQLLQKLEHDSGMWSIDSDIILYPFIFALAGDLMQAVAVSNFYPL